MLDHIIHLLMRALQNHQYDVAMKMVEVLKEQHEKRKSKHKDSTDL